MRGIKPLGRCRPVGLCPTTAAKEPVNKRIKQMMELTIGKDRTSAALKVLNPPDEKRKTTKPDDAVSQHSSLSSYTESERVFLDITPKGPPLKAHELPVQPREDIVAEWLPGQSTSSAMTPQRCVKRRLDVHSPATSSSARPYPTQGLKKVKKIGLHTQKPIHDTFDIENIDPSTAGLAAEDIGCDRHEASDTHDNVESVSNALGSSTAHDSHNLADVVSSLMKTRDEILKRRQTSNAADNESEDDVDDASDTSFVPSIRPSSDSGDDQLDTLSEAPHDTEEQGKDAASSPDPLQGQEEQDKDNQEEQDDGASSPEEDEEQEEPAPKKRKKVRVRQPVSAKRKALQVARNSGQSYISPSGKQIAAKSAVQLTDCRKHCVNKLSHETCSGLCTELWNLADHDKRAAYIASLIEIEPKASMRLRHNVSPEKRKNRQLTFKYHVVVAGANVDVCKGCFLKIYQVSPKFVEIVTRKKTLAVGGAVSDDLRGKACTGGVSPERLAEVHEHLNSFPRYQSHYARATCDKLFLSNTLTLKIMFDEYKDKYPSNPVSRFIYEREFHAMGLKIKPLKIDTCQRCDKLATAIMYSKNEEEKKQLKLEQELHHRKAEKAKTQKQLDSELCKDDDSKLVASFDLQQCLPTPHLQTSVVFYKRQLWTYNLTIHNCKNGKSVHNMWHEGEAERGPNEVGSALYKFIMSLPNTTKEVTLYSDTCGGQNKNTIINAALQTSLLHKETLQIINQKFLVAGHTHLDCDTDHAAIEKKKNKAGNIHTPRDWYNLVRSASKNFTVQAMTQEHQLNFKALLTGRQSPLVKRKKNIDGDPFRWREVSWIQHRKSLPLGTIAYKDSLDQDLPFSIINMKRYKKGTINLKPQLSFSEPRKIAQKKKDDLINLLHLIDPECHRFYKKLKGDSEVEADEDPDLPRFFDSEEESSSDEDC